MNKRLFSTVLCATLVLSQMPAAYAASVYDITVRTDSGATIQSEPKTVNRGEDCKIVYELEEDYRFDYLQIRDQDEKENYEIDYAQGDTDLSGDSWCEVDTVNQTVTVTLNDVDADYRVSLYTEKLDDDEDDDALTEDEYNEQVRVSVSEGSHISIDTDTSSRPDMGETIHFTITPDAGYLVDEVILTIGDKNGKADADSRVIRVDGHSYYLSDESDGSRVLTVHNVGQNIRVRATAMRGSYEEPTGGSISTAQWHPVSASGDAGVTVIAGTNSVINGGTVGFTMTPKTGYELDALMVRVGTQSQTVAAAIGNRISMGGTYGQIAQNGNSLYLSLSNVTGTVVVNVTSNKKSTGSKTPNTNTSDSGTGSVSNTGTSGNTNTNSNTGNTAGSGGSTTVTPKPDTKLIRSRKVAFLSGNGDGTITPEAPITRAEASMMIARLMHADNTAKASFSDVSDQAWYANAVGLLEKAGAYEVEAGGVFRPDDAITRSELVHWFTQIEQGKTSTPCDYTDVNADTKYYKSIAYASEQNWISGYADGTFRPNASITRAEAAYMTLRIMGWTPNRTAIAEKGQTFSDMAPDYWAYYELSAASAGLYQ